MGPEPEGADQNEDVDQEVVDEDVVDVDVVEEDPVAEAEEDHAVRYLDKFFECVLFVQNILNWIINFIYRLAKVDDLFIYGVLQYAAFPAE